MSFLLGRGKEVQGKMQQGSEYSKMLQKVKAGEVLVVRVKSTEDYAGYEAHSVHKSFYTTPCARKAGIEDLYDKAAEILFNDAKEAEKSGKFTDDEIKEMRKHAGKLLPKGRYLFSFFSVDTGQQILVDMSALQGEEIIKTIERYKSKLDTYAFELTKSGANTNSKFVLSPVLEDLTPAQQKHFDEIAEKEIDGEAFEKAFQLRDRDGQIKDLQAFGFDITRLGIEAPAPSAPAFTGEEDVEPLDPTDDF